MSVKMEKYLTGQRKNLDVENPDDIAVWEGIEKRIRSGKHDRILLNRKIRILRIRNIAATAIILFALGYITNDIINKNSRNNVITLSSIDKALGVREKEYKTLVSFKTEEVRSSEGSGNVIISELFGEIKKLDIEYDQAMRDLRELGPNERVINTIFSTYEQRIRLLELIILETNKIKSHENNEKVAL
jgi:hypothetical protein